MCGIVGIFGLPDVPRRVHEGLVRLEYRGYDSAGVAWLEPQGIEVRKALGAPSTMPVPDGAGARVGIGHTRWATHGGVSEENAHPHLDGTGRFAVVHNGTLEGHVRMRRELEAEGHQFLSDTDTEILAHLYERFRRDQSPQDALQSLLARITGSWAFVILDAEERLAFAVHRTPLVIGVMPEGAILASDVAAIVEHTRDVVYLEDGDHGIVDGLGIHLFGRDGFPKPLLVSRVDWDLGQAAKAGHAHFMLKEIHETPQALNACLGGRIRRDPLQVESGFPLSAWGKAQRVRLVGCGTSYHAAMLGGWFLESWAGIPARPLVASDLRDRPPLEEGGTLYVGISQSGETLDTLEALRGQLRIGHPVLGLTNVRGSSLERLANGIAHTRVGPEVGVAASKTFCGQVAVLAAWAIEWGLQNGTLAHHEAAVLADQLDRMPRSVEAVLGKEEGLAALGRTLAGAEHLFFLGHGAHLATASEAALKFKEITYQHAEGVGAAELKHGPFALLDAQTPCVFFLPRNAAHGRTINNIQEVRARGAPVHVIAQGDTSELEGLADSVVALPETDGLLASLPFAVAGQLVAYHAAHALGREIDQPRNLAKSVTVE